jgi:CubicO group peptidase (beta-lactamase class C family)
VVTGVSGYANTETGQRVTPDTLFQIGSTTKLLTAALAVGLVEEGLIELDVPVVEQLPGFALSDGHATLTVTPRHLMSMSSGMDNGPYVDHGRGDDALAHYVASLAELPQNFPPGTGFGYSNASTTVTGRLVEHVTGLSWDDAVRTRLLEPAGLAETATLPEDLIWRRFSLGHAPGQNGRPAPLREWSQMRSRSPSGSSTCASAGDLVRFAHLYLHEGRSLAGRQVLEPPVVRRMQSREVEVPPTLVATWWGLGPYCNVWDGVEVWGHSGTQLSGSSFLLWVPERRAAIATTANVPNLGYPFAQRVFRVLFPEVVGVAVPEKPQPPRNVSVDSERLVGTYEMITQTYTVCAAGDGGVSISGVVTMPAEVEIADSPLIPLTPTTFLPTDPAIDGRRGWALAFVGAEDGPARHLVNGVFALRRVA